MVIIISKRNRITKINFNLQKLGTAKYFYPKFRLYNETLQQIDIYHLKQKCL